MLKDCSIIVRLLTKVDVLHIHVYIFSRTVYLSIMYLALCIVFRWFSPDPQVSPTNKTDRHDIAEILLKVALNTIKPNQAKPLCIM